MSEVNIKLIKGVEVEMGGTKWIIPPLTLGQIEDLSEEIGALSSSNVSEQFKSMRKIIHMAMSRNYPELSEDTLKKELLDMGNIFEVVTAVMGNSGMVKKLVGEMMASQDMTGVNSTQS